MVFEGDGNFRGKVEREQLVGRSIKNETFLTTPTDGGCFLFLVFSQLEKVERLLHTQIRIGPADLFLLCLFIFTFFILFLFYY